MEIRELVPADLYRRTDADRLPFNTTAEMDDLVQIVGQPRASEAVEFGVGIRRDGYNIFALGPTGTGKRSFVRHFFEQQAATEPVPPDWCYVNNFDQPYEPRALSLPAGRGIQFRQDVDRLVGELRSALSVAFEREEYQTRRQAIMNEFQERQGQIFQELQERAQQQGVGLLRTPTGLAFAPVRNGQVLSPEEIQQMSEEEKQTLQTRIEALQDEFQKALQQVPGWQREMRDRLQNLDREMVSFAVGGLIEDVRRKYADLPEVIEHLEAMHKDILEHVSDFVPGEQAAPNPLAMLAQAAGQRDHDEPASWRRYEVNLLVDHSQSKGAPVIYEDNPTYQNVIGRVEYRAQMGALLADFSLIKPGALHQANGGYLLLDARKVLTQPYAWEGLKRALQARQIRIESIGQMLSMLSSATLEPEPIPLDVKVALVGDRELYYQLFQLDPDFGELFKVAADFEDRMERTAENELLYAHLIGTLVHRNQLRPFDRSAVARLVEHGSRMAEDSERLSTQMRGINDLVQEADYWAGKRGAELVSAQDVQHAIDAHTYRSDRIRERVEEEILRQTILIDTEGAEVGQINGLSVIQLANFAFGRASRISARVRMGKGDVVDIEREVELSGPLHSKGVLILASFLGARYASEKPFSLTASLVFEQSYSGVEGDSASSAELYVLLSAIAGVPIKQSLAVTGSVNQHGQVQAIGGVNEKIEGFFDLCKARGLAGNQGVLIPSSNIKHLMLRQDVVDAVAAGQFHIYPVDTIDQGIEILTGVPAGERDGDGRYPTGTINDLVEARLDELARKRPEWEASKAGDGVHEPG